MIIGQRSDGRVVGAALRPGRHETTLRGVPIAFPFPPYALQLTFMTSMLEALQGMQHALLESPTGTGKTLCLLCAVLSWQRIYVAAQQAQALLGRAPPSAGAEVAKLLAGAGRVPTARDFPAAAAPGGGASVLGGPLGGRTYTYADGGGGGGGVPSSAAPPAAPVGAKPRIFYASRTHSQLAQVLKELKRSGYSPSVAVLGSRDQLCVHGTISKLEPGLMNYACKAACKRHSCGPKLGLDKWVETRRPPAGGGAGQLGGGGVGGGIMDIEDLVKHVGGDLKMCPYFYGRSTPVLADADLVVVPYNYLVDPTVRASTFGPQFDFRNSVMIFDEAHNLEDVCAESTSFDLTGALLTRCIRELRWALEAFGEAMEVAAGGGGDPSAPPAEPPFEEGAAKKLFNILIELERYINSPLPGEGEGGGGGAAGVGVRVEPGAFIFQLLNKWAISHASYRSIIKLVEDVCLFLAGRETAGGGIGTRSLALDSFSVFLNRVFRLQPEAAGGVPGAARHYRVIFHSPAGEGEGGGGGGGGAPRRGRTLSYWCFSPAVAMSELRDLGVRSVLLASGTLSPMDSYAAELNLPFPVRLENEHVVGRSQVFAAVVTRGSGGKALNSNYENRDSPEYLRELSSTLVNVARFVPHGMLVFFPSYAALEKCVGWMKGTDGGRPWAVFSGVKEPFVEPRAAAEFPKLVAAFNKVTDGGGGAVLLAVCRGKVSEGIDFSNARGRAVIITGLPFAPHRDPRVMLKRSILEEARAAAAAGRGGAAKPATAVPLLSGGEWYALSAVRAVNQAAGRVIRHKEDYGAILLLDERFERERARLSAWFRPDVRVFAEAGKVFSGLRDFFTVAAREHPVLGGRAASAPRAPAALAPPPPSPTLQQQEELQLQRLREQQQQQLLLLQRSISAVPTARGSASASAPAAAPRPPPLPAAQPPSLLSIRSVPAAAPPAAPSGAPALSSSGSTVLRTDGLASVPPLPVPAAPRGGAFGLASVRAAPPPPPALAEEWAALRARASQALPRDSCAALEAAFKEYHKQLQSAKLLSAAGEGGSGGGGAGGGGGTVSRTQIHERLLREFAASVVAACGGVDTLKGEPEGVDGARPLNDVAARTMQFVPANLREMAARALAELLPKGKRQRAS